MCKRLILAAALQCAMHHDPASLQIQILVGAIKLTVYSYACHINVLVDLYFLSCGDRHRTACGGNPATGPASGIGPAFCARWWLATGQNRRTGSGARTAGPGRDGKLGCRARAGRPRNTQRGSRSYAAVKVAGGWHKTTIMTALNAERDSLTGRNSGVPGDWSGDDPQGGCAERGVPEVGNLAGLVEIEVNCPAINPGCTPVSNIHVNYVTITPLVANRDFALQCCGCKRCDGG